MVAFLPVHNLALAKQALLDHGADLGRGQDPLAAQDVADVQVLLHERDDGIVDLLKLEQEPVVAVGRLDNHHLGIVQQLRQLVLLRDREETIGFYTYYIRQI